MTINRPAQGSPWAGAPLSTAVQVADAIAQTTSLQEQNELYRELERRLAGLEAWKLWERAWKVVHQRRSEAPDTTTMENPA